MQKQIIQIENIEAGELLNRLDRMESAITALTTNPQKEVHEAGYLTRKEVAKLFGVSLVTIHDWINKDILKAYKIANRVYFKRTEVENSLVQKGTRYV